MAPEYCPNCGEAVPDGARACPACGSCEETGWSLSAQREQLGIPDESFDYDNFVRDEFGAGPPARLTKRRSFWWIAACLVLLVFLALVMLR
jgi:hypothetical protein